MTAIEGPCECSGPHFHSVIHDCCARLAEVEAMHDAAAECAREFWRRVEAAEARLAAVHAFCADYPRTAKYPDYDGGYESALDDVLSRLRAAADGATCDEQAAQMVADVRREHAAGWRDEARPNLGPVTAAGDDR